MESSVLSCVFFLKNFKDLYILVTKSQQIEDVRQKKLSSDTKYSQSMKQKIPDRSSSQSSSRESIKPKVGEVKARQFPPADVKPRQFPPADVQPRQFPPPDVRRREPPMKKKPQIGSKRKYSLIEVRIKNYNLYSIIGRILDDDDSEYDSEMDDFIDDGDADEDYSKYISEIFGYDKSKYRDMDDDVENMESTFAQQMREEVISTKIGEFRCLHFSFI